MGSNSAFRGLILCPGMIFEGEQDDSLRQEGKDIIAGHTEINVQER